MKRIRTGIALGATFAGTLAIAPGAAAAAEVTARVSAPKRQTEEKRLLHVPLGSEIAYGNFFRMRQGERYRIELTIRRASSAEAVTAGFDYRHRF